MAGTSQGQADRAGGDGYVAAVSQRDGKTRSAGGDLVRQVSCSASPERSALKWQRLKPYEKFAAMIESHWDGIAAYCQAENKVSLGFVEGLNNKIRVIQRRAYGIRDQEYLRLKILTCTLPDR